jgi:hypothetical protein
MYMLRSTTYVQSSYCIIFFMFSRDHFSKYDDSILQAGISYLCFKPINGLKRTKLMPFITLVGMQKQGWEILLYTYLA